MPGVAFPLPAGAPPPPPRSPIPPPYPGLTQPRCPVARRLPQFRIKERGSSVTREVRAGFILFLVSVFSVLLNPVILSGAASGYNTGEWLRWAHIAASPVDRLSSRLCTSKQSPHVAAFAAPHCAAPRAAGLPSAAAAPAPASQGTRPGCPARPPAGATWPPALRRCAAGWLCEGQVLPAFSSAEQLFGPPWRAGMPKTDVALATA